MGLPRETMRALLGYKARVGWALTWDGARPKWGPSGVVIVDDDEPTSPATGQLWFDTDDTC